MNRSAAAVLFLMLFRRSSGLRNSPVDYIRLFNSLLTFEPEDLEYISSRLHRSADMIERIGSISSFSSIFSAINDDNDKEISASSLIPFISRLSGN